MQVEFQAYAYKTSQWDSVESMLKGEKMPYVTDREITPGGQYTKDYVRLGTVRVTIEFDDNETIVANQIEALKASLHTVRAENHLREQEIIEKISKLQAIEYTPADQS